MALVDNDLTAPALTDDQKNERIANAIMRILARSAKTQRQALLNIKKLVQSAPGTKADLLDLMGVDKTEATTMINSMKTFVNTHKGTNDQDIDV
jgi:hypothetical protein